jgi:hypothetical protein
MTTQLKSIIPSILFSALVTFAFITGQPHSSNASEQPDLRDEIIGHVYTPHWSGDSLLKPQGEVKAESNRYTNEQLGLRDEIIGHVYTPHWAGDPLLKPQGEVKAESNRYTSEQLDLRDEIIDNVYTPHWAGDSLF